MIQHRASGRAGPSGFTREWVGGAHAGRAERSTAMREKPRPARCAVPDHIWRSVGAWAALWGWALDFLQAQ